MQKLYFHLLAIFLALPMLTACSEEEMPDLDYYNWTQRNSEFVIEKLNEAKDAVAAAQATYGEAWEDYCDWRIFPTYIKVEGADFVTTDSICVKIVERGECADKATCSGSPLYTDSVQVRYIGRTMPTVSYPEGRVFDYTGTKSLPEEVFNPELTRPTSLLVSNTVEGFTTALQKMHIGDRWVVYIPAEMGYGANNMNAVLRGGSTLIFELQLVAFCRAGGSFYE